jgi:hypothetical protein
MESNTSAMQTFIGVKMIQAMPMSEDEFASYKGKPIPNAPPANRPGYLVRYPDAHGSFENAYESWSPKEIFEAAYLPLSDPTCITPQEVNAFIRPGSRYFKVGEKTCVGQYTLVTGMELTESAACVDPANYDESKAAPIIMGKVREKLWFALGFLLQWGKNGLKWQPLIPGETAEQFIPQEKFDTELPCEPVSCDLDRDQADHIADRTERGPTSGCNAAKDEGCNAAKDEGCTCSPEAAQRIREAAERLAADEPSPQQ